MTKRLLYISTALLCFGPLSIRVCAADTGTSEAVSPNTYIRECVDYEPDYITTDSSYAIVGSASIDNTKGTSAISVSYVYEYNGASDAYLSGFDTASSEADTVFAKLENEADTEVTASIDLSKGIAPAADYTVAAGSYEGVNTTITAIKTAGKLKYRVYKESSPDDIIYQYKTLEESYIPLKDYIHLQTFSVNK